MNDEWYEGAVCFLCNFWWLVLIIVVLAIVAIFSRAYWIPLLGLV